MKIQIHRGQDQIGGSIIEISTATTRLIFDVGAELDESEEIEIPPIDGLFVGIKKYDAVFVSHYHPDHIGLLGELVDGIPVYMGEKAFGIPLIHTESWMYHFLLNLFTMDKLCRSEILR